MATMKLIKPDKRAQNLLDEYDRIMKKIVGVRPPNAYERTIIKAYGEYMRGTLEQFPNAKFDENIRKDFKPWKPE